MFTVSTITELHRSTVDRWHRQESDETASDFLTLVREQHRLNYNLWHQEDIARSPDVSDAEIAQVKRNIDRLNQERNDHIEMLDTVIIELIRRHGLPPSPYAPLNTETPGSVIDRLSIMSLRIYHMNEQVRRTDVSVEHQEKAAGRLVRCREQLQDLSLSLQQLLDDLFAGRKILKVYHQFKMYNDPTLNPYLYQRKAA